MIWPVAQIVDALRVARGDRLFPAPGELPAFSTHLRQAGAVFLVRDADALAGRALAVAISQLGLGEEGGNNRGPHVAKWIAPAKLPANWCAGFCGWIYAEAALGLGLTLPFRRSLGAKRLGRNVGAVGRIFRDPREAKPGDLVVQDRGPTGSWMGHVSVLELAEGARWLHTIQPNSGPRVRRLSATWPIPRFAFFASVRR